MRVPGANVLSIALRAIQPQPLTHLAFVSRSVNSAGDWVTVYDDPVDIAGSMQAVDKRLYQELGLDLAKNYMTLYTTANVRPTARDRSGDLVTYGGRTWLCESDGDWAVADGWRRLLVVEVPGDE